MLRGGFCLSCNLKAENSFIRDPNAYSFNNSNYLPQPQYENYLCNLCGNNSHDGYDCQQQFPLVYEQESSYNQNYNNKYYPHDSPSFPCCDNCGGSHATFQCQPMDQNIDFSGSDQIQTPRYLEIHHPSQEISNEVFQAKGDLMKSIQTLLKEFNYIPFGEKPKILLQAWDKFFAIQHAQPEDSNELFQKLLEDLQIINKELIEEECCIEVCEEQRQNMENTMLELVKICQPKELYCMHDNVDDLIESALNSKPLSINLNSQQEPKYSLNMGYKHLNTTPKIESDEIIKSSVEELVQILSRGYFSNPRRYSCDMLVCENSPICDDHSEIFSDSNKDDDISSDDDAFEDIEYVEASLPDPEIVSLAEENDVYVEEEEVDLEDIFQIQDVILREKLLSINRVIANIESLNDNPTPDCVLKSFASFPIFEESDNFLSDNSSPEFKTFSNQTEETRSGSTTTHADNSFPEYDSFCFEIEPGQERLINVVKNDISDDSTNDPLLEEVNLFIASDNSIPPGIKNIGYDLEGDIRFLEELRVDNSIPNSENELSDNEASDFDNPSFLRPPPEPPNAEFDLEPDAGEEILVVINDNDELECLDPRDEIDVSTNNEDDDYFPFMFVIQNFLPYLIYSEVFPFLLSAESKDTIFDPEIPSGEIKVHIEVLSVLWGNRLSIRTVHCRCLGKDIAKIIKNQSKTEEYRIQDLKSTIKVESTGIFPQ
nr:hypothetical protein [Tanacetum cinerariifolium]